jgi:hypothetical protein
MPDAPLSGADIETFLAEVSEVLERNGPVHVVVVVGGYVTGSPQIGSTTLQPPSARSTSLSRIAMSSPTTPGFEFSAPHCAPSSS